VLTDVVACCVLARRGVWGEGRKAPRPSSQPWGAGEAGHKQELTQ